jgi:hypothetical protein
MYWKNNNLEDLENEIWKDIDYYDNLYKVSNLGRIKSINKIKNSPKKFEYYFSNTYPDKIIKQRKNKNGQVIVTLSKDGFKSTKLVSRIVAKAFIDNPEKLSDVDHIIENGDKTNNSVSNLQWMSPTSNCIKYFESISTNPIGVYKVGNKYIVNMKINGKSTYINTFDTEQEAEKIYKEIRENKSNYKKFRPDYKYKGITKYKNKWISRYQKQGVRYYIGIYKDKEDAKKERQKFIKKLTINTK